MTLKPCPFCGDTEPAVERVGDPRQSSIVACGTCGATVEGNESTDGTGAKWNDRVIDPAEAVLHGLLDWLESEHVRACEKAEACHVAGDDRAWQDWYSRAVPFGEVLTKIKELEVTK